MYYGSAVQIDVADYLEDFSKVAVQAGFSRKVLAEVDGHEIPAFVRRAEGVPRVYVSSGMHGDEPAGPLALYEFLKEGLFGGEVEWMLCPLMNPTGISAGSRENKQGLDLNRDYLRRSSAEVAGHVRWLEKQPVPDVFLSLHEDWESTGFYLYEIQKCEFSSVAHSILEAAANEIGPEPSSLIDDHAVREPGWIFHKPEADFPEDWPEAIYMANMGTQVSYTFETPSSLELERRINCHKLALNKAVEEFMNKREA